MTTDSTATQAAKHYASVKGARIDRRALVSGWKRHRYAVRAYHRAARRAARAECARAARAA
jgi:hypothetical protein